jgi:ABC-2 type transport system ATP-binding protein
MINISHINFKYAGQKEPVFSDFSLQLMENRIYGLLGKNGTGKSTLLYLISGLLRPASGSVSCGIATTNKTEATTNTTEATTNKTQHEASARHVEMLRELFLVPEEFDLPQMTLDRYVRLNAPFYPRFSREVMDRCLQDFELDTRLDLRALSMGQKKKVFMSFALATNTRYLLMDEPTNGLDIPSKSQFRRVVAQNMSDERTILISTHQVHDVEALLDHILILSQRALLLNAPVADLTARYTFSYRSVDDGSAVVYSESVLQGRAVMAERREGDAETQLNLELLFNAVTKGQL